MPILQRLPFSAPRSHSSRKAAERIARNPQRGAKVLLLLRAYMAAGDEGLADFQAVEVTGLPLSSICSIRGRLMEDGLVGKGREVTGKYGLPVAAWFFIGQREAAAAMQEGR